MRVREGARHDEPTTVGRKRSGPVRRVVLEHAPRLGRLEVADVDVEPARVARVGGETDQLAVVAEAAEVVDAVGLLGQCAPGRARLVDVQQLSVLVTTDIGASDELTRSRSDGYGLRAVRRCYEQLGPTV